MSSYKLISSDSHIFEPPDLWENWIEPKYRDRAPRVVREEKTDQWYADGDWKFGTFNLALAGVRFENPEQLRIEGRYEEVPAGGMDPHAHVEDLDVDGVARGGPLSIPGAAPLPAPRRPVPVGHIPRLQQLHGRRLE